MKVSAREATSSSLKVGVGIQDSVVKKRPTAASECSTSLKRPRVPTNSHENAPFDFMGVLSDDEAKNLASDRTSATLSTDAVAETLVVPEHSAATGEDCVATKSPSNSEGAMTAQLFIDL